MLSTFSSIHIVHHIEPGYLANLLERLLLPLCSSRPPEPPPLLPGRQRAASPGSSGRAGAKHRKQPRADVFQVTTSSSSCSLKCMLWRFFLGTQNWRKKKDVSENPDPSTGTRTGCAFSSSLLIFLPFSLSPAPTSDVVSDYLQVIFFFFFENASQYLNMNFTGDCQTQSHDWKDILPASSFCFFCYK